MKLSDVMSAMNLASYAEVGLVLFLGAFVAVVIDIARRGKDYDARGNLPLSDDDDRFSDKEQNS
jgi:hypothetical protein